MFGQRICATTQKNNVSAGNHHRDMSHPMMGAPKIQPRLLKAFEAETCMFLPMNYRSSATQPLSLRAAQHKHTHQNNEDCLGRNSIFSTYIWHDATNDGCAEDPAEASESLPRRGLRLKGGAVRNMNHFGPTYKWHMYTYPYT